MAEIAYYCGQFVGITELSLPIEERAHQFGDGIYEVVRVYGGRPFLLDGHLDRMERSLRVIGIKNPYSRKQWVDLIGEAIRRSGDAEAQVYWQVTRGVAPRLHTFPEAEPAVALTVRPVAAKAHPEHASLLALPDERWTNPFVKSVNLLPNVIAKENAKRAGAVEAMLVRAGTVTEGSGSNVWFGRAGELYTAPANRYILGGITRDFVIQLAGHLGIGVHEQPVTLDQLTLFDEVFITSTTQEITSVSSIFTTPAALPALRNLPDEAPESLLIEVDHPVPLWEQTGEGTLAGRLRAAYTQAVERFRLHEAALL